MRVTLAIFALILAIPGGWLWTVWEETNTKAECAFLQASDIKHGAGKGSHIIYEQRDGKMRLVSYQMTKEIVHGFY